MFYERSACSSEARVQQNISSEAFAKMHRNNIDSSSVFFLLNVTDPKRHSFVFIERNFLNDFH